VKNFASAPACRFICAAVLIFAVGSANPLNASAQASRSNSNAVVEDAIQDMQWRNRLGKPQNAASQQPVRPPVAQKPDLRGLPKQLPQEIPALPAPVQAVPGAELARPVREEAASDQHTLIKPKIGKPLDRERKPQARKRISEPVRQPLPVPSHPYGMQMQAGQQQVMRQPAPMPVPRQATAAPTVPPPARPQDIIDRRTGLIKPRIATPNQVQKRSARGGAARHQDKRPVSGQPAAQMPQVQTQAPAQLP
jgi:hypothetical protein